MMGMLLTLGINLLLLGQCLAYCPQRYTHETCYKLHDAFETSLLDSNQNKYNLREEFFPSSHAPPVYGDVNYTVQVQSVQRLRPCHSHPQDDEENLPTQQSLQNHSHHHFYWSDSGLLSKLDPFTLSFYQLGILSSIFESVDIINYLSYSNHPKPFFLSVDITLNVSLPCTPSKEQIEISLEDLTSWLKVYAKGQSKICQTWDIANKGYGVLALDVDSGPVYGLLFATYISLVITVTILLWGLSSQAYCRTYDIAKNRDHCCLIWGTSIVSLLLNVVTIISEPVVTTIWFSYPHKIVWPKKPEWAEAFFLAKIFQIFFFLVADLIVTLLIVNVFHRGLRFSVPALLEVIADEYCCCKGCRDHSLTHKFLQVLATWSIMLSIHLIAIGSVPTFLWMLVEPIRMLSVVALVCGGIFTTILFLTTLFSILPMAPSEPMVPPVPMTPPEAITSATTGEPNNRSRLSIHTLLLLLLAIPSIFTTITLFSVLYFKLIATVVNTSTPTGILVSFIPSLALTVTGWFLSAKIRDALSTRNKPDSGNNSDHASARQPNGNQPGGENLRVCETDANGRQLAVIAQHNDGGETDSEELITLT